MTVWLLGDRSHPVVFGQDSGQAGVDDFLAHD